jgi:hypothetical protein
MERKVIWFSDGDGYVVLVCHGIRVASRFVADELGTATEIRQRAAAKAVELALEHRVDLTAVREVREPLD